MIRLTILALLSASGAAEAMARPAVLYDGQRIATIVHDDAASARLASGMLARDLERLSGRVPTVSPDLTRCGRTCIVVGRVDSDLVRAAAADAGVDLSALTGQWERYVRVLAGSRRVPGRRYLLIAGSDRRGAIWGTVDLTRELGVSAWEWWADVAPVRSARLVVDGRRRISDAPSVQYRGIFLNDEDWGLQPWAARTYEPETGDIGPRTYSRIFELMWRLKANVIWPAMHDSTKPFYQIAGNAEAAKAHDIVVGTSHAEPMMRNNVREWDERKQGPFNFFTNRDAIVDYWRRRVDEVRPFENVYTIGMRGRHDSAMEGAGSPEVARDALTDIFGIQRDLLARAQGRPATTIPQALTLYKEVLDVYGTGLRVPDDVTLVWPEDNYGYINQLPTPTEQARAGGSGVYYHISYWGRPHDYLWLATTHPALIREQMDRAWQMNARRMWMLNVGDIKPGEYLTQYFLDLAFDHRLLDRSAHDHLTAWATIQFGRADADAIAGIMTRYYDLAFERRPEFMGFSQTEPTRPIRIGDYVRSDGKEAQDRIDRYLALVKAAEEMAARISSDRRDAYFQLVLYPVRGAAKLNERNLKLDLAALYARQGRANVNAYAAQARAAHATIVADTAAYNAQHGGKWRGIMDMAPRRLPVFAEPRYPSVTLPDERGCALDVADLDLVRGRPATRRLIVYGRGRPTEWTLSPAAGLTPDVSSGRLTTDDGFEARIAIRYDGRAAPGRLTVRCDDRTLPVSVRLSVPSDRDAPIETAGVIAIAPSSAIRPDGDWEAVPGLGMGGTAARSRLTLPANRSPAAVRPLRMGFRTDGRSDAEVRVIAIPVHPLTSASSLRLGVQIDGGAIQVVNFASFGRSDEWKLNVLSNAATRSVKLSQMPSGSHSVAIYALDPGVLLNRIEVRLDGAIERYGFPS